MAKQGWFDRMLKKFRDEGLSEEDADKMRDAAMNELPSSAFSKGDAGGGAGDQHVHVHLHNKETDDEEPDPMNNPDPNAVDPNQADPAVAELASRVDALEEQVAALLSGEEDVELEDQDTQDRRRFKLRRGDALKATRDEAEVPKREPEIVGETDLPGIEDLDKKTHDSVAMETLWANTLAAAEIIVPGYRVPTFDAKHHPNLTAKRLCALRKGCLGEAARDAATGAVIARFTGGADLKRMTCDAAKIAFHATADALKTERSGATLRRGTEDRITLDDIARGKVPSNRDANAVARDFWASQGAGNGAIRH